jgi:hypothetical protein
MRRFADYCLLEKSWITPPSVEKQVTETFIFIGNVFITLQMNCKYTYLLGSYLENDESVAQLE